MKGLITEYNAVVVEEKRLEWKEVTDLSSTLWFGGVLQSDSHIPKRIKLDAIKHHHHILRADEEICLIKKEMEAVISFHLKEWRQLVDHLQHLRDTEDESQYSRGAQCLLQFTRLRCEGRICTLKSTFSRYIQVSEVPTSSFLLTKISEVSEDKEAEESSSSSELDGQHSSSTDSYTSDELDMSDLDGEFGK